MNNDCGKNEGVRQYNLHPVDFFPNIIEYHKKLAKGMSQNAFQKHARKEFNKPKFQMKPPHGWLTKEQQIRASSKKIDKEVPLPSLVRRWGITLE